MASTYDGEMTVVCRAGRILQSIWRILIEIDARLRREDVRGTMGRTDRACGAPSRPAPGSTPQLFLSSSPLNVKRKYELVTNLESAREPSGRGSVIGRGRAVARSDSVLHYRAFIDHTVGKNSKSREVRVEARSSLCQKKKNQSMDQRVRRPRSGRDSPTLPQSVLFDLRCYTTYVRR
jgi:hypothetical protein